MDQNTNFLIPKHEKLSEKEVANILEKYSLKDKSSLPKIRLDDAAISQLEVTTGDVVVITRKSCAGESKYYRVVIN
jgi:DNA-directed RNA polymerase subunit H (RpoH/RPB5)